MNRISVLCRIPTVAASFTGIRPFLYSQNTKTHKFVTFGAVIFFMLPVSPLISVQLKHAFLSFAFPAIL